MSNALVLLHFHASEPFGPVLEAARDALASSAGIECAPFDAAADLAERTERQAERPRLLPPLLRLSNTLGVPVLLSLSNERLLDLLRDPAEQKALAEGVSRGRFLPTPVPGLSAELFTLPPFEAADELRLNMDLWKRVTISPPFAAQAEGDARLALFDPDPARAIPSLARHTGAGAPGGRSRLELVFDLDRLARAGGAPAAMKELGAALQARRDLKLASPTKVSAGWPERILRDLLASGGRYPRFVEPGAGGFDVRTDGFPVELLRAALTETEATRTLAPHGDLLLQAGYQPPRLAPALARGLLLRRLARVSQPDGIARGERVRASFLLALALLDAWLEDEVVEAAGVPAADWAAEITARVARETERSAGELRLAAGDRPDDPAGFAPAVPAVAAAKDGRGRRDHLAAARHAAAAGLAALESLAQRRSACTPSGRS